MSDWREAIYLLSRGFMHPSNSNEVDRPSHLEVVAAARELDSRGRLHGWWPVGISYDNLDPIGKDEFEAIVERVLMSAAAARRAGSSDSG